MTLLTAGQRLDAHGQPIAGTGFEYDSNGRLADLLAQRTSPIFSRPYAGEWIFEVNGTSNGAQEPIERVVGIGRAGNPGPPQHFHVAYDEYVEVVQGETIITLPSGEVRLQAGETFNIEKNMPHSVRTVGTGFAAAIVEIRPASIFGKLIRNFFGLDHDGLLSEQGQPGFLQAMAFGSAFVSDTIFTTPPPAITVPLAKALTPLARLAGYQGRYARYENDDFWLKRVAVPELQPA